MRWKIGSAAVLAAGAMIPAAAHAGTNVAPSPCSAVPASIAIVKGSGQSAVIGARYGMQLQVIVKDSGGNAVSACPVVFAVVKGSGGAGATFVANGRSSITHHTSNSGNLREQITANGVAGTFTITATVKDNTAPPVPPVTFTETNLPATASSSIAPATISEHLGQCAKFYYAIDTRTWDIVSIYNAGGKRVRFFKVGWTTAGLHATRWCGKSQSLVYVTPGTYTVKLSGRMAATLTAPIVVATGKPLTVNR